MYIFPSYISRLFSVSVLYLSSPLPPVCTLIYLYSFPCSICPSLSYTISVLSFLSQSFYPPNHPPHPHPHPLFSPLSLYIYSLYTRYLYHRFTLYVYSSFLWLYTHHIYKLPFLFSSRSVSFPLPSIFISQFIFSFLFHIRLPISIRFIHNPHYPIYFSSHLSISLCICIYVDLVARSRYLRQG